LSIDKTIEYSNQIDYLINSPSQLNRKKRSFKMAGQNQAKRQFIAPSKFKGTLDEDASEWLQRYESTGIYNRWQPADLLTSFGMYLEDSARKWFNCTTLPEQWEDSPEVIGVAAAQNIVEVLARAEIKGFKTIFLQEF